MSIKLTLVENFDGMTFLNSPRVTETERCLEIKIDSINANAAAVFMLFFVMTAVAIAYCFGGGDEAAFMLVCGLMGGSLFVGAMYLIEADQRNQVLPHVEKDQEYLVLASGTIIHKCDITCFRQHQCKTQKSNFKLVLTTVVTQGTNGNMEYAVASVMGGISEDCIGEALAGFFDAKLLQDDSRKFTVNELTDLGLS